MPYVYEAPLTYYPSI